MATYSEILQKFKKEIGNTFQAQKNIVDAIHYEISKQDEIKSEIAKLRVKIDEIIEFTIRSAD